MSIYKLKFLARRFLRMFTNLYDITGLSHLELMEVINALDERERKLQDRLKFELDNGHDSRTTAGKLGSVRRVLELAKFAFRIGGKR